MRRRPATRILASLTTLLFAVAMFNPYALDICPVHGGIALPAAAGSAAHTHCVGMEPAHQTGGTHHHSGKGHQCSCPGPCCSSGVPSLAAGRIVALPVVPVAVAAAVLLPVPPAPAPAAPDTRLHPPLGPPALLV